jgi:hypothetical protein
MMELAVQIFISMSLPCALLIPFPDTWNLTPETNDSG